MIFTLPNLVSIVRVFAVPLFLWLLLSKDNPAAAGWLLGAIGATDWVDGFLARKLNQVSELGKVLDPAADRLAVAAAVVGGWISGNLPWPIALAIAVRELIVATGALLLAARLRAKLEVRYLGKVATLGLYVAIPSFFIHSGAGITVFGWMAWGFGLPSLVLYYIVGGQYVADMRRVLAEGGAVSSSGDRTGEDR